MFCGLVSEILVLKVSYMFQKTHIRIFCSIVHSGIHFLCFKYFVPKIPFQKSCFENRRKFIPKVTFIDSKIVILKLWGYN